MGFGDLLRDLIEREGLSVAAFAASADMKAPQVFAIMGGKRPPPLHRVTAWADILRLKGPEREQFTVEAELAHCPDSLVSRYRAMAAEVDRLRRRR